MFKVGDWVCLTPKSGRVYIVDTCRGIIEDIIPGKREPLYAIFWEDGILDDGELAWRESWLRKV